MTDTATDPTLADLASYASSLAAAISNPETIARKVGEYFLANHPDRVSEGYWVTLDGSRDKGLAVRLYRRSRLDLDALLGGHSAGLAATVAIAVASAPGWTVRAGLGVTAPFHDLDAGSLSPVAVVTIKFKGTG